MHPAAASREPAPGCSHSDVERLDFQQELAGQRETVILRSSQEQGFEPEWAQAAEQLPHHTVHRPNCRYPVRSARARSAKRDGLDELALFSGATLMGGGFAADFAPGFTG
ncbi:MAG: hypothetical protein R3E89_05085 [Thiolinea sp.]